MGVSESHRCSLPCFYRYLLDGVIKDPVRVLVAFIHFLTPIVTGQEPNIDTAVRSGHKGRTVQQIRAAFIRIDVDLASCPVYTGIGFLHQFCIAIMRVGKSNAGSLACFYRQLLDCGVKLPVGLGTALIHFLHPVVTGSQLDIDDTGIGRGKRRTGHQLGTGFIRIKVELPAAQVLAVSSLLDDSSEAFRQVIVECHRCSRTIGYGHLLRIGTGTHILGCNGAVGVSQFLHIDRSRCQTCHIDVAVGIGGVRSGQKRRTRLVSINTKLPACQIRIVLRVFLQAQSSRSRGFQLEVGVQAASGWTVQGDGGLVGGTAHVVNVIGGIGCGRDILRCCMHRTFRDGTSLGDVQSITGLIEFRTALIRKAEVRQDTVGVIDACLISIQGNGGRCAAGAAGKRWDLHCCLHQSDQLIIVGCKVGYGSSTGIVEDIAAVATFIGRIQCKSFRIPETADDLKNEELGRHSQRYIGIVRFGCGGDTDRMVPQLIRVQQDQTNGFPAVGIQRIPDIAACGASAAAHGHAPVNGVSAHTGSIIPMRLNTVQRVIRIGYIIDSRKMPAEILKITILRAAGPVPLVANRDLTVQRTGIVSIVSIVKQQNTGLGAGSGHDTVIIRSGHKHGGI